MLSRTVGISVTLEMLNKEHELREFQPLLWLDLASAELAPDVFTGYVKSFLEHSAFHPFALIPRLKLIIQRQGIGVAQSVLDIGYRSLYASKKYDEARDMIARAEAVEPRGWRVPIDGRAPTITDVLAAKQPMSSLAPQELDPFKSLQDEIDRLFDDFGRRSLQPPFGRSLPVDITETDEAYEITAELPGVDQDNIEVTFSSGTLSIKMERTQETEEKKNTDRLTERSYGSFWRSFLVPKSVDVGKIEASFDKGVLTVTLPKIAEEQKLAKTIAVRVA